MKRSFTCKPFLSDISIGNPTEGKNTTTTIKRQNHSYYYWLYIILYIAFKLSLDSISFQSVFSCFCLVFSLSLSIWLPLSHRAFHRLHAERHRHPWRLDCYQEGQKSLVKVPFDFPDSSAVSRLRCSFRVCTPACVRSCKQRLCFSGESSSVATKKESWK